MQPPPPKKKVTKAKWLRVPDVGSAYFKLTNDRVPCAQTIRNWMTSGKVAYSGDRVKLKSRRKGNLLFTTQEWLEKFIGEIAGETL